MKRKKQFTWKTRRFLSKIKFHRSESDTSDGYDTDNLNKHPNFDDDIASFDLKNH